MTLLMIVLYSSNKKLWKIADFGLSAEGSTKHSIQTGQARGTGGYRAPELLNEQDAKFTKKVDIWALGCILYELAMKTQAFRGDWDVSATFATGSTPTVQISSASFPEIFISHLSDCVHEALAKERQNRPSISTLCPLFRSYCAVLDMSVSQNLDDLGYLPAYSQWREFVCENEQNIAAAFSYSENSDESTRKGDITPFLNALVDKFPNEEKLKERLAECYESKMEWDSAIITWQTLVSDNYADRDQRLHQKLAASRRARGNKFTKITVEEQRKYNKVLFDAAKNGHSEMVKSLLEAGAEVDSKDILEKQTPLSMAAKNGHLEVVKSLLQAKAEVDVKATYGKTSLSWAAMNGHLEVVKSLLQAKAEVDAKDIYGLTPLERAQWKGYRDVVELLKKRTMIKGNANDDNES
jgi:serine/threonine protein kinase